MQQIHNLKEFLDSYGPSLAKKVNDELEVIHDALNDEKSDMDQILVGLLRHLAWINIVWIVQSS